MSRNIMMDEKGNEYEWVETQMPEQCDKPVKKHSHYFKDVSRLNEVDIYRVLKLFNVTDPCLQHAAKKILCSGQRGVKDMQRDIQEAIDTLTRCLEMIAEDSKINA